MGFVIPRGLDPTLTSVFRDITQELEKLGSFVKKFEIDAEGVGTPRLSLKTKTGKIGISGTVEEKVNEDTTTRNLNAGKKDVSNVGALSAKVLKVKGKSISPNCGKSSQSIGSSTQGSFQIQDSGITSGAVVVANAIITGSNDNLTTINCTSINPGVGFTLTWTRESNQGATLVVSWIRM